MTKNTTKRKTTRKLKPTTSLKTFGHGKVIFNSAKEFPETLEHNGCFWYRSIYEYTMVETGMVSYLYETYDREEDLRLYVDAAGHIWDEKDAGIM